MSFNPKNYTYKEGIHRNNSVIWVQFPFDDDLKNDLRKKFSFAKWSATHKCWYLPDNGEIRKLLNFSQKVYSGKHIISHIHEINQPAFRKIIEQLQLRAYSPNTIKTYAIEFAQLLYFLKESNVDDVTPLYLRSYFLYCTTVLKLSENMIHSRLNAVKFYFEQVLFRDKFFIEIPRPKKKSLLPKVLSKEDILKIFDTVSNLKHLMMLKLCYGMGLRVSEITNLKITHIDSKRMLVLVSSGKGKKDRYVPLPESILDDLRKYYLTYKPKVFLFEGQYGGQYSTRSVQFVFKNAMKKANVNKPVGIHGLRHSYATHLMEYGTDMYLIQKLLGHNNIRTTEIYAKVSDVRLSKIKSPLDNI